MVSCGIARATCPGCRLFSQPTASAWCCTSTRDSCIDLCRRAGGVEDMLYERVTVGSPK
jgi:hypothetical protein